MRCVRIAGVVSLFCVLATPIAGLAGLTVNEVSTWPTAPTVATFARTDANIEAERDMRFTRDLSQTFQLNSAFKLDKIFIDYEEGLAGKEFTIHVFPVADVFASGLTVTPSDDDLLGGGSGLVHTTTASISIADAGNNQGAVMEFDLTGPDEIQLDVTSGTAGYAFQIERTGLGSDLDTAEERAFKWHHNSGENFFPSGRSTDVSGGPDGAGDDFLMALVAVPGTVVGPGDVNSDFVTDINDYIIIRNNFFGTGRTRAQGDITLDGNVNFADFRLWKNNRTAGSGSASDDDLLAGLGVPEPGSLALVMLGTLAWLSSSRRRDG